MKKLCRHICLLCKYKKDCDYHNLKKLLKTEKEQLAWRDKMNKIAWKNEEGKLL